MKRPNQARIPNRVKYLKQAKRPKRAKKGKKKKFIIRLRLIRTAAVQWRLSAFWLGARFPSRPIRKNLRVRRTTNFFIGNITDAALVNSLSALELGKQYVAVTQKGCDAVRIEREIPVSYLEKLSMKEVAETNRIKGSLLANDICKNYRREGLFFDEILDQAMEGNV